MYGLFMSACTIVGWELGKWAYRRIDTATKVMRGSRPARMTYCPSCAEPHPAEDHRCDPQKQARWAEFTTKYTGGWGKEPHGNLWEDMRRPSE